EFDPTHVNEELADVLIYCLQMTDVLGVDPKEIIFEKLEKNAIKYPVKK
ncbi:MAG: MazG-like family protein, partial [Turicibacter sp.]|nr:MazG-like family protein [Turicibacter sp.]